MKRILIANRGEIAVRIIRAARELGYGTVAVYSEQDLNSLHVAVADQAIPLDGTTARETYLDCAKILTAARTAGADAVHPGYGFLSENADFARSVTEAGLTWIGPSADTIEILGNKVTARELASRVGAPLVAGTDGPVAGPDELNEFVAANGLPVAIKAVHGGGGRGMRVVQDEADLEVAFAAAVAEAEAAFGRGDCFVEQFLDRPRHVEAQVIADTHGHVVVVGTRDCSLQRRNQKLVEEAPAPFLDEETERRIHESARAICSAAGYTGAGTVEYLLSSTGSLSFLEVNTRLQVEHPVTEESTGFDLVVEQLRIAEGLPLSITTTPRPTGHAIEFRLNAEDPALGYLPMSGTVTAFEPPTGPGVRVDTGIRSGDEVAREFDSMIAKLIVSGPDRATTLIRAQSALAELVLDGIPTVLPFHRAVIDHADFAAASGPEAFRIHTRWIETDFDAVFEESPDLAQSVAHRDRGLIRTTIEVNGTPVRLGLPEGILRSAADGASASATERSAEQPVDESEARSPVSGTLVRWVADDCSNVSHGDHLAVVEAMKMETAIAAPRSGYFTRSEIDIGGTVSRREVIGHVSAEV